jgi:hypothetical protein
MGGFSHSATLSALAFFKWNDNAIRCIRSWPYNTESNSFIDLNGHETNSQKIDLLTHEACTIKHFTAVIYSGLYNRTSLLLRIFYNAFGIYLKNEKSL